MFSFHRYVARAASELGSLGGQVRRSLGTPSMPGLGILCPTCSCGIPCVRRRFKGARSAIAEGLSARVNDGGHRDVEHARIPQGVHKDGRSPHARDFAHRHRQPLVGWHSGVGESQVELPLHPPATERRSSACAMTSGSYSPELST